MKKLKTMGESGVERVGEGLEERRVFVCGGAAGADLWRDGGQGFERWIRGAVERVRALMGADGCWRGSVSERKA